MKVKQALILLAIIVFCSVVSYALVVLAQADETPQWSNFIPETETIVTILDPVTINVNWYDDGNLDTVIIWENSTGEWQGHNLGG